MNQDELDLLHGYLDGTISDADFARLQTLLRASAGTRRTLRGLATVDAKLQGLGALQPAAAGRRVRPAGSPPPVRPRYGWLGWGSLAAAGAVLGWYWLLSVPRHSSPRRPDLAAAFTATHAAISRLAVEVSPAVPAWASPTAPLLDQPRLPQPVPAFLPPASPSHSS
ncbi:MAG: hypothetical protein WC485_01635 [Opitutaceae bacterium]